MSTEDWAVKAAREILKELDAENTSNAKKATREFASIISAHAAPMVALLREAKREHQRGQDSMDDCPIAMGEDVCRSLCITYTCDCGADAWNARIDAVLEGHK